MKKTTLAELVKIATPITDDDYSNGPMGRIWEEYMVAATKAHNNARKAIRDKDFYAAYWNSLHAIGCYAAAHGAWDACDTVTAYAQATNAYFAAMKGTQAEYADLSDYSEQHQ